MAGTAFSQLFWSCLKVEKYLRRASRWRSHENGDQLELGCLSLEGGGCRVEATEFDASL